MEAGQYPQQDAQFRANALTAVMLTAAALVLLLIWLFAVAFFGMASLPGNRPTGILMRLAFDLYLPAFILFILAFRRAMSSIRALKALGIRHASKTDSAQTITMARSFAAGYRAASRPVRHVLAPGVVLFAMALVLLFFLLTTPLHWHPPYIPGR